MEFNLDRYEKRVIVSPGLCIYCVRVLPPDELTDEHVIPYALGHNTLVFHKSSCKTCAAIIQRYEQEVLKKQLGTFRLQVDAPSRTKAKDRPTSVELPFAEVDDQGVFLRDLGTRSFRLGDAPLALSLWQLPEPRLFSDDADDGGDNGRPWSYVEMPAASRIIDEVRDETGARHVAMKIGEVNRSHFLRFLAKTAHAFAVAELGIDGFNPCLTDIILDREDEMSDYVGGTFPSTDGPIPPEITTILAIGGVGDLVAVRIQFYHVLGSPAYAVVVGRENENTAARIADMIERYD
nr:HNH endonuclease [Sphingomonas sp. BAUL-RG-20F-R05-02]